jgi:hypothetical protein
MIAQYLVGGLVQGAVLAAVAYALSRHVRDLAGRVLLVAMLWVAALAYVFFAADGNAGGGWLAAELAGVALFGGMGLRGLRGSPLWIAAGWALHPVWDLALHYAGPGRAFAPDTYTITCLSFDLLVAAYVVVVHRLGLVGEGQPGRRGRAAVPVAGR